MIENVKDKQLRSTIFVNSNSAKRERQTVEKHYFY